MKAENTSEDTNSPRILLVDDEKPILSSLKRLLRPHQYNLFTAESAADGLKILEKEDIDIVISDMRMPNMDGATFLQIVLEKWPDTVRMLLSGFSEVNSIIDGINKGQIYHYITKPWDDFELLLALQHGLEQKTLEKEKADLLEEIREQNRKLEIEITGKEKNLLENINLKDKFEQSTYQKICFIENISKETHQFALDNINIMEVLLNYDLTQEQKNNVAKFNKNVKDFVAILQDVIDLAKNKQGKLEILNIDFNLHEFINNIKNEYEIERTDLTLSINFNIVGNIPHLVQGDPKRIRQIIRNLIDNANQYSTESQIEVAVSIKDEKKLNFNISFAVRDKGTGIDPMQMKQIFNTYSECIEVGHKFEGKDFGLEVCRELTKLMGGEVGCESALGKGSCFWFTVALKETEDHVGNIN